MIYTKLTKKALLISFNAHKEQTDKCGMPYVYHPFHLSEQMDDEFSTCAALLHDVVEDTETTIEELSDAGFPSEVTDAVALLTHEDDVDYFEYVKKIKPNTIAKKVKLADLKHNSDMTRLDNPTDADFKRREKYLKAIEILTK
ncbi:MAG: GTP pyrophosphokinase [Clostridia bacterium]|nr:GTP pyrophosphokinase [Clostridia bacterium]